MGWRVFVRIGLRQDLRSERLSRYRLTATAVSIRFVDIILRNLQGRQLIPIGHY